MATGFGQGGRANVLPGREYPEYGSSTYRDLTELAGGQRGLAALPSRVTAPNGPAPADPRFARSGARGPVSFHRGAFVEDAGAPRLAVDGELYHDHLPWSRPAVPNIAGLLGYIPPTPMPSWTANTDAYTSQPVSPIPHSTKRLANRMVREEFGSSRELFPGGSLARFVAGIQRGYNVQGRRWVSQAKTQNPSLVNRSRYAMAGSYGQTTRTLKTAPTNLAQTTGMGAY